MVQWPDMADSGGGIAGNFPNDSGFAGIFWTFYGQQSGGKRRSWSGLVTGGEMSKLYVEVWLVVVWAGRTVAPKSAVCGVSLLRQPVLREIPATELVSSHRGAPLNGEDTLGFVW